MKQLFTLLLLIFSLTAVSQVMTSSPTGKRISNPIQLTIGTTVETTLFADSIYANNLTLGKYYEFRADLSVTTGTLNTSTLTVKIKYGSQTINVINAAVLGSGLSNAPISIKGFLVGKGSTAQFMPVEINQSSASLFSLTSLNSNVRGTMTVDSTVSQLFSITATLGGTLGSTVLIKDWSISFDF